MLVTILIFILIITTLFLKFYVETKIPELKGRPWTIKDLKKNHKVFRISKIVICFLLLFVGGLMILNILT